MLNATAAILLFPPQLDLNPDPQDALDLLQGSASEYYADIIRALGMRLTLVPSSSTGGCSMAAGNASHQQPIINCIGCKRLIAEGTVDFSLNEMTITAYDPPIDPIKMSTPGPALYMAESSFLALPDDSGGTLIVSMTDTISSLSTEILLTIVALLSLLTVINWSATHERFVRGIPLTSLAQLISLRANWYVRTVRRRLALLACLLMALMFQQMFIASIRSSLVLIIPAHYPQDLTAVAESSRPPILIGGLELDKKFLGSHNPVRQRIGKKAQDAGTIIDFKRSNCLFEVAQLMQQPPGTADAPAVKGITFVPAQAMRDALQVILCVLSQYSLEQLIRHSEAFVSNTVFMVYRPGIRQQVKDRLDRVFKIYAEAGLCHKYNRDPISRFHSLINVENATLCLQRFRRITQDDADSSSDTVDDVRLSSYADVAVAFAVIIGLAATAFVYELQTQVMNKKRRQAHAQWKRATSQRHRHKPLIKQSRWRVTAAVVPGAGP